MLWYDDSLTTVVPRTALRGGLDAWLAAEKRPPRKVHSARMSAFIAVAQVLQGVADAALARTGHDDETPGTMRLQAVLHGLAALLAGPAGTPAASGNTAAGGLRDLLEDAGAGWLDEPVACRSPEGYAHYALYPEAYAVAARASGLGPRTQVVGLRSIGTGLSAIVAAALAAAPAATVRPTGDVFERVVVPGPSLRRRWRGAAATADFAVVDEGPGLSGSSFRAAVLALEASGVSRDRIHLFPSHAGAPGPRAPRGWAEGWQDLHRHPADMDAWLAGPADGGRARLAGWIGDTVKADVDTIRDLSAGAWRAARLPDRDAWPAASPAMERRKAVAATGRGPVLARFAGLGQVGEDKLALARALAACGFVPEPFGLAHGFLVERWHEQARPALAAPDRDRVLAVLPGYLAARAHLFPALGRRAAPLPALAAMVRRNASVRFGAAGESASAVLAARAPALADRVRPVCIDGRLDPVEWLVEPDGRVLKADAVDHHDDHGLVGCQDIAWDVAGAAVEFDLDASATGALRAAVAERGVALPDADLVAFYRPCYAAARMAADILASETADAERPRLEHRARRYATVLARDLGLSFVPD